MNKILRFILNPFFRSDEAVASSQDRSFYSKNLIRHFSRSRRGVFALRFLCFFILIALLADIFSNEKPLIAKYNGTIYFPVFRSYAVDCGLAQWPKDLQNISWDKFAFDWSVFPLVPY